MALSGDPLGEITYQVTDQGSGNFRLRRKIQNGAQYRIIDVTDDCKDYLDMLAQIAAEHEGGTVIV